MTKRELLDRCARDSDERVLLSRVLDKAELSVKRGIPAATQFLSPGEQAAVTDLLNAWGHPRHLFFGGYEDAERRLCAFLPDWLEEDDFLGGEDLPLSAVEARFPGGTSLTHRDILGSLMGLGITREKVGDILISPHSADVIVSASIAEFLLRDWDSAGRVRLTVTEIGREELVIPEAKITEVQDTVSSLRLDAVVSSAFSMSRGKAADLIAAGKVSLDHVTCIKSDKPVGEGSSITARGFGKAVVRECSRLSKKGRIILIIDRYT